MSEYQDSYQKQIAEYRGLINGCIKSNVRLERFGYAVFGLNIGLIDGKIYSLCRYGWLDGMSWGQIVFHIGLALWIARILRGIEKRLVTMQTLLRSVTLLHQVPTGSNLFWHHADQYLAAVQDLCSKKREDTPDPDAARGTDPRVPE